MEDLIRVMDEKYEEYLKDESRLIGAADSISFPKNEAEVLSVVNSMRERKCPITIQGGRTGIVGGAVPSHGHIMNLTNLNQIGEINRRGDGKYLVTVGAGVTLMELEQEVRRQVRDVRLFWPAETTETTATVGGVLSCNAKGIHHMLYGDAANYVESVTVIHADGMQKKVSREELEKTYLGKEGLFGVITEATLELLEYPKEVWGITFFFLNEAVMCEFAERINTINRQSGVFISAVEYMDKDTINLLESYKKTMAKIKDIPQIDEGMECILYIELFSDTEIDLEMAAEELMEIAMEIGCDLDLAWAATSESEVMKMRDYRHGAAEAVNLSIELSRQKAAGITKLAADISWQGIKLCQVLKQYRDDLARTGLRSCIFGHVTGNHLHVNILPDHIEDYQKGRELLDQWGRLAVQQKGSAITEHGAGKLKRDMFLNTADQSLLQQLRRDKEDLDPHNLWNPGNLL